MEVDLRTDRASYRSAVPSGASTGIYMFWESRDGEKNTLPGIDILKAVFNATDIIAPKLFGQNWQNLTQVDGQDS